MDASKQKRVEILARQFWAAYGFPKGCYDEFYFRAGREIALVEDLRRVSTRAALAHLHKQTRVSALRNRARLTV
jgi:hypothetical protein